MREFEIPEDFYSFESGKPFTHCIECEKYLLNSDTDYLIEKAVRNYEGYEAKDTVFDYAICMDCAENLRKKISTKSWEVIMNYFQENVNDEKRQKLINQIDPKLNLAKCMIKGTEVGKCKEYQIFAQCRGKSLNMEHPPYLISGEVMDEMLPLLSNETIDEMNGFSDKHFSPDPNLFEKTPRIILV